ncbi:SRPBCC family protein [Asticcacaulis solisilvae]|uniref:SRPBCC family protein n=1 Tax=Asticcacaulis solisilvae TaxID=1217274 RepID=UPI003FD83EB1
MTGLATADAYGVLTEPKTLKIERLLPGPIDRIWNYLTDGSLRRLWLAAGPMEMKTDGAFEFIWRNDELTDPPGRRPDGFGEEHRMEGRVVVYDPPHKLAITWSESGGVTFELTARGDQVLLTLTHSGVPNRGYLLSVSAGWHMHLDIMAARLEGRNPAPFWDGWARLKADYDKRLPA